MNTEYTYIKQIVYSIKIKNMTYTCIHIYNANILENWNTAKLYVHIYMYIYMYIKHFIPRVRIPKWLDPLQTQRFVRGVCNVRRIPSDIMQPSFVGLHFCVHIYIYIDIDRSWCISRFVGGKVSLLLVTFSGM